jgi:5-bromo-4-chloroindolyl phosphate hydrolysis protein
MWQQATLVYAQRTVPVKARKLNPAMMRKGGLVGLGLIALAIGLIQKLLSFGLSTAYEALDRRNERNLKKGALDMSKRRDWRDDDDDDDRRSYTRKMEEARRRYELEIRASRDVQREQRKAVGRVKSAWRLAAVGAGLFLGSVIASTQLGTLAGIGFGLMVGGSINWFGSLFMDRGAKKAEAIGSTPVPRRAQIEAPTVGENALPTGRAELVQQVLGEAATSLRALDAIMPKLRHPDSVSSVARIVAVGNRLMQIVAASPEKLSIAQRVFTYYCPETVKVADALSKLELDARPDVERITSTQTVLKKLEVLFERTELELKADEGKELDIDLKLLDQSIESDLRTRV